MQFQVPQFIEVEDRIFGPFTFKQFIYFVGAAGFAFIAWRLLPIYISGIFIIGFGALGAALALFQWNGRPFVLALEYGFYYLIHTKLYIWSHERRQKKALEEAKKKDVAQVFVPRISDSKLHDLAWSLDIKEKIGQVGIRNLNESGTENLRSPETDALKAVRTAKEAMVR